jgi:hypothetical protein
MDRVKLIFYCVHREGTIEDGLSVVISVNDLIVLDNLH